MTRRTSVGAVGVLLALTMVAAAAAPLAARVSKADRLPPPVATSAQQPAAPPGEFVPVGSLPRQEQLPAAPLLVAAYAFVWVVLLVYVWTIWSRLRKVEREIRTLSARVTERPGSGA